jgi:hypothetical protein
MYLAYVDSVLTPSSTFNGWRSPQSGVAWVGPTALIHWDDDVDSEEILGPRVAVEVARALMSRTSAASAGDHARGRQLTPVLSAGSTSQRKKSRLSRHDMTRGRSSRATKNACLADDRHLKECQ